MRKRGVYYDGWYSDYASSIGWTPTGRPEMRASGRYVAGRERSCTPGVMCWVAFDRAIRMAQEQSLPAPLDEWRATRDTIYREIMEKGWSEQKQSFVQYYGSDAVDASALLISLTRFTSETDPRIVHTIERIQRELMHEPHVYRYREERSRRWTDRS